jgi:hypothetical protein
MIYIILILQFLIHTLAGTPINSKAAASHPFYVSITETEIINDTLQISLRVFTDDLELALNESTKTKIFLNNPSQQQKEFILIKDYLFNRLQAGGSAKPDRIEWIGHEFEDDVCWIYGYLPISKDQRILFIKHMLFYEVYADQQNIVHFKQNGEYTTELATRQKPEVRFVIE